MQVPIIQSMLTSLTNARSSGAPASRQELGDLKPITRAAPEPEPPSVGHRTRCKMTRAVITREFLQHEVEAKTEALGGIVPCHSEDAGMSMVGWLIRKRCGRPTPSGGASDLRFTTAI